MKQKPHIRTSTKGKPFKAGQKKPGRSSPLFEVTNVPDFKRHIRVLKEYNASVFTIGNNQLRTICMDPTNVSLISFKYDLTTHLKEATYVFPLDFLYQSTNTAKKGDKIMYHKSNLQNDIFSSDYPRGMIKNLTTYKTEYDEVQQKKLPEMMERIRKDAKYGVIIKGQELVKFKEFLTQAQKADKSFKITSGPSGVIFYDKEKKLSMNLGGGAMDISSTKISIHWIKNFFGILDGKAMLRLHWQTDYPVIMDIEAQNFTHSVVIAPRVEND